MRKTDVIVPLLAAILVATEARGQERPPDPLIHPIDGEGFKTLLAGAKGNPLLVSFWATWCVPCVEEFSDFLRLKDTYSAHGLQVVFISLDRPRDAGTSVLQFLRKNDVRFTTYIKMSGDDEAFINSVDPDWSGALPATFVYNSSGTVVERLIGQQSFDSVSTIVKPLLRH
jgi:thiol-disulfide isomerase/thioredoxin